MSKSTLRTAILVLTLITAAIHLFLGIGSDDTMFQVLFVLNGLGYLALLWAFLRPPAFLQGQGTLVRYAYMAFAIVTIVLYFVFNRAEAFQSIPGLATKLDEVLLVIALFMYSGE